MINFIINLFDYYGCIFIEKVTVDQQVPWHSQCIIHHNCILYFLCPIPSFSLYIQMQLFTYFHVVSISLKLSLIKRVQFLPCWITCEHLLVLLEQNNAWSNICTPLLSLNTDNPESCVHSNRVQLKMGNDKLFRWKFWHWR